ncbi:MAG TPA: glycosyltransferase [Vicinamibacterales bacterium]|nr:glycosyltransferase [Vicinamibacterales bacterium]
MTLDPVSGAGPTARTVQLSRALTDLGVTCGIATCHAGSEPSSSAGLDGVEVVTLPSVAGRFRVPVGNYSALNDAVRRADIVLMMNHWTTLNAVAFRATARARKPHIVCPCGALPLFGRSQRLKTVYNALVGRRIVRDAARQIAVTRDEVDQIAAYGVPKETIVVIPNGIPPVFGAANPETFRTRHALGAAPIALFLGRLSIIKGPDLLVSAFTNIRARFPHWHLVMAGPDEGMLGQLQHQVAAGGLHRQVHFVGYLNEEAKRDALAAANLLVVPSRSEAMSIVVLEAAAAGRPVLVTDRCGLAEVADAGGGWVVPATVAGLTRGLEQAFRDDAGLASRGDAWRRFALDRYAWPGIAARHKEMFSSVLAEKGRP